MRLLVGGTTTGELHFVDLSSPTKPRLVKMLRLSRKAVVGLKFDQLSNLLIAITADNMMFVIDPRASKSFDVLGFIRMTGEIFPGAFTVLSTMEANENKVSVAVGYKMPGESVPSLANKLIIPEDQFNKVILFQLDSSTLKQSPPELFVHAIRREYKETALGQINLTLSTPSKALTMVDHHRLVTLVGSTGKLANFSLSSLISTVLSAPATVSSDGGTPTTTTEVLQPVDYGTTDLNLVPIATGVTRSPDAKWLVLTGKDGQLIVVSIDDQAQIQTSSKTFPVDKRLGGIRESTVVSSCDNRYVMGVGADGSAFLMQYGFTRTNSGRSTRNSEPNVPNGWAQEFDSSRKYFENWRSKCRDVCSRETRVLESMPIYLKPKLKEEKSEEKQGRTKEQPHGPSVYEVKPIKLPEDATIVEMLTARAAYSDDEKIKDQKSDILANLVKIRVRLHDMMQENQNKPDLEKLDHQEFDLDAAEQARMLQEGDAEAKKLKQKLEAEVQVRLGYIQRIKKECLDSLKVQSKGINGMLSQIRVNNYPLKERTVEEIALLDTVKKLRQIEITEFKTRAKEKPVVRELTSAGSEVVDGEGNAVLEQTIPEAEITLATDTTALNDVPIDGSEDVTAPVSKEQSMLQQGSFAGLYGADFSLFYDQFSLQTKDQKLNQILLMKDAIYSVKEVFNKEFEEACRKKDNEMSKINEKNNRLRQIQSLIEVFDKQPMAEPLVQYEAPHASKRSTAELFNVADSEVPAEKYISPAERKRLEEAEKAEKERLLRERGDNPRERGLMEMMGGVLEVKKEDELRKEVPTPTFIADGKPEDEWNEEEIKIAQDYRAKTKELNEEREKYKKLIEVEAKKLRQQVLESVEQYEEILMELFTRKLKTEMAIYHEELKISRIQLELVIEASLQAQIKEFLRRLDVKRNEMSKAQKAVSDARKNMAEIQDNYDTFVAEDKLMDKGFRKEFFDCNNQQVDILNRFLKNHSKHIPKPSSVLDGMTSSAGEGNPFKSRPSTASIQYQTQAQLEIVFSELDKESNCPETIEPAVWKRFCHYRRRKIQNELKIKDMATGLTAAQNFLHRRMQDEERLRDDVDKLSVEIAKFEGEFERFVLNLEVQVLVKQGQVEVKNTVPDCPLIPDFSDAVLVHRGVVEQLNSCILQKGASKITNMDKAKKTKRDIVRLEWEHRRLNMEMNDLDQKLHDIDHLRLTREVLFFLEQPNYEDRIHHEIAQLEDTLQAQQKYHLKVCSIFVFILCFHYCFFFHCNFH